MKVTRVAFTEAKAHLAEYGHLAEEGRSTVELKHTNNPIIMQTGLQAAQDWNSMKYPCKSR